MANLKELQKRVYANKVKQGFNVTDIYMEFCLAHAELSEAVEAHAKKLGTVGEELADVAIYLLGISEILGVDLEQEILRKVEINEHRRYTNENGVVRRIDD